MSKESDGFPLLDPFRPKSAMLHSPPKGGTPRASPTSATSTTGNGKRDRDSPGMTQRERSKLPKTTISDKPGVIEANDDSLCENLMLSSKQHLLAAAHTAVETIMNLASGDVKLKKSDIHIIGTQGQNILAIVAALDLRLAETEAELQVATSALKYAVKTAELEKLKYETQSRPNSAPMPTPPATYASRVQLRLPKETATLMAPLRPPLPCVVAYPTPEAADQMKTSEQTKEALMKAIDPANDGFQIVGVKKTARSGVFLRVSNEEQLQKLKSAEAIKKAGIRLEKPKGRQPRIIIKDVPKLEDEEFIRCLYNQNIEGEINITLDEFQAMTRIYRRRNTNAGNRMWFGMEVTPKIRQHLVETKQKVFIGWNVCRFVDDLEVVRCSKCQMLGHVIKHCTEKSFTCAHCCGQHESRECDQVSRDEFKPKCATCNKFKKPTDHATGSSDCPALKQRLDLLISTTQYGCTHV